jgi:hypothetical protein
MTWSIRRVVDASRRDEFDVDRLQRSLSCLVAAAAMVGLGTRSLGDGVESLNPAITGCHLRDA